MKYFQECLNLEVARWDLNKLQSSVQSAVYTKDAFIRNSTHKSVSTLLLRSEGNLRLEELDLETETDSLELLAFVQSIIQGRDLEATLSKKAMTLVSVDGEWVLIIAQALEQDPSRHVSAGLLDIMASYSSINQDYFYRLLSICHSRSEKQKLQDVLTKFRQRNSLSLQGRIELMHWLFDHDYGDYCLPVLNETLVIHIDNEVSSREITKFLKKVCADGKCDWEVLVAYISRLLAFAKYKSDAARLSMAADLIYGHLKRGHYSKVPPVYQVYWLNTTAVFPHSALLLQYTHLMNKGGQEVEEDICAKTKIKEDDTDLKELALYARKLELEGAFNDAFNIWQKVLDANPSNPSYLRFAALNVLKGGSSSYRLIDYAKQLMNISDYQKLGGAVLALAHTNSYNAFLNYIFEYDLHLEEGDEIYDLLLREIIPSLWNDQDMWSKALEKGLINAEGEITHSVFKRTDFALKSIISHYIELKRILDKSRYDKSDVNRFLRLVKLILRNDLKTSYLIALLNLVLLAEEKPGFFQRDEFGDFESDEVNDVRATFLWLLAKRAEYEYAQIGNPDLEAETLITNMELSSAKSVFERLKLLS